MIGFGNLRAGLGVFTRAGDPASQPRGKSTRFVRHGGGTWEESRRAFWIRPAIADLVERNPRNVLMKSARWALSKLFPVPQTLEPQRRTPAGKPATRPHSARADHSARSIIERIFPGEVGQLRVIHQDGPPPSLDAFEYKLAPVPDGARLKAWAKLQEVERRLAVASWAMWRTEPETGEHAILAQDAIGACLYAFEATLQVLKDELERRLGRNWFDPWLSQHRSNSLTLRSLRTVRHLAVHVGDVRSEGGVSISVVKGHGGTVTWHWNLPWLTEEMLASLHSPRITNGELEAYRDLRRKWPAAHLMEQALGDLRQIVFDAEQLS